jgi:hypothetical protein
MPWITDVRSQNHLLPLAVVPIILGLMISLGCNGRTNIQCTGDVNCDLTSGGKCTMAKTGNRWCAYPAADCDSGFRYSTQDTGDGVEGVCTTAPDPSTPPDAPGADQMFTLSLTVGGSASGSIASTPAGFVCAMGTCSQKFLSGTQVELAATSTSGAFLGWSGTCHGFQKCVVTMDQDRAVTALFGTPGQALWAKQAGGTGDDTGRSIAADPQGNLLVTGEFSGTIQIGSTTLTSAGGTDVFVAKYDGENGDVLWAKRVGGAMDDRGAAIAADSEANVYIAGAFNGTIDLGGGPIASHGSSDAFFAKLDPSGGFVWATGIGGTDIDVATSLSVHGSSVAVVGSYRLSMNVGGNTITGVGTGDNGFVVKLSTAGAVTWAKSLGDGHPISPNGVAVDGNDNVVVAGRFSSSTNLGGGQIASVGFDDVFLAKYAAATGAHLFSKGLGSGGFDSATSVAVDPSGNIVILGFYADTMDVGGPTPLPGSGNKMFLVKYSLAGAYLWADAFGGPAQVIAHAPAIDAAGNVAVTGQFCDTINFGGGQLTSVMGCSASDWDIFVARFSGADGSHIRSLRAGGTGLDVGYGVSQLPDGRTFVTGGFQGFAEFGGQGFTSSGGYDVFLLGLAPL